MKIVKEFLIPTITLCAVCLVAAVLLGLTNKVTAPVIERLEQQASDEAKAEVMPLAKSFGAVAEDAATGCTYSEAYAEDGSVIGYAVTSDGEGGYNGKITLMVGINAEGAVENISFLSINETPSIGMKLTGNAEWLAQFTGLSGSAALKADSAAGSIDAVTGATKTSRGITDAVDNALECYANITGEVSVNG